jgi:hypothetical protein
MVTGILANLSRQKLAMDLLAVLLEEEFSLLASRDTAGVTSLEFSLQELLRQMAAERFGLRRLYAAMDPKAKRLADLLDRFDPEARRRVEGLLATIDKTERRCSDQATRNYRMALGLYDVTKSCLDHLQSHLIPRKAVYGSRGRLGAAMPAPGRVDGRC